MILANKNNNGLLKSEAYGNTTTNTYNKYVEFQFNEPLCAMDKQ